MYIYFFMISSVCFKCCHIPLLSILHFSILKNNTLRVINTNMSLGRKNKTTNSIEKNFILTTVVIAHDFTVHVGLLTAYRTRALSLSSPFLSPTISVLNGIFCSIMYTFKKVRNLGNIDISYAL